MKFEKLYNTCPISLFSYSLKSDQNNYVQVKPAKKVPRAKKEVSKYAPEKIRKKFANVKRYVVEANSTKDWNFNKNKEKETTTSVFRPFFFQTKFIRRHFQKLLAKM